MTISVEYSFNLSKDSNIKKLVKVTSSKINSSMHTMVKNRIDDTVKKATGSFKPGAVLLAQLMGKYVGSYIPTTMSVASLAPMGPRTPTGIWTGSLAKAIMGIGDVTRVTSGHITMQFNMIVLDMPRVEHSGLIGEDEPKINMTGKGGSTGEYAEKALANYPNISQVLEDRANFIAQWMHTISVDKKGRVHYFKTIRMIENAIRDNELKVNSKIVESAMNRLARQED